ncbi:MAG: hypothetical protein PHE26_05370 [Syntrophomonadaceae bacterium]|nr:hypothetical protein [Syntrophomonadaceae bacterium]
MAEKNLFELLREERGIARHFGSLHQESDLFDFLFSKDQFAMKKGLEA